MMAPAIHVDPYYDGSRLFASLSSLIGLQLDQTNFVICQFVCLFLGYFLRVYLHPSRVSTNLRHVYCTSTGLATLYFCFGNHVLHVITQALMCYVILRTFSPDTFQRYVMTFALLYLSVVHLLRQIFCYGSYTLDISGPMMVITQKVTSLAFSLHDGKIKDEKMLKPSQKQQLVTEMPSIIEYMSYCFHFQTLQCGPFIFYKDYQIFLAGKQYRRYSGINDAAKVDVLDGKVLNGHLSVDEEPSPNAVVLKKVFQSFVFAVILLFCASRFPVYQIVDDDYVRESSFVSLVLYLVIATTFSRTKYYHAWLLSEAICNISGLGFNGFGSDGEPKWDGCSNVDVSGFELSTSVTGAVRSWNCFTGEWLRHVAYHRAPFSPVLLTYLLSSIWHGFYPGYYLTFLAGALYTESSRRCRRAARPYFQTSQSLALFYDVFTFLVNKVVIAYLVVSFLLLEFRLSVRLYSSLYFLPHIILLLSWFVAPLVPLHNSVRNKGITNGSIEKDKGQ